MSLLSPSDLILNTDGSVYHLSLHNQDIADIIFLVGDPGRVGQVSRYFDRIEVIKEHREFVTHTGTMRGNRMSVISTGIGTDNIDIVLNELHVLAKVDLATRQPLAQPRVLTFIRIGTSGALQPDISPDSIVISAYGLGLDALGSFYQPVPNAIETEDCIQWAKQTFSGVNPYMAKADASLLQLFSDLGTHGITATCAGFYGPQGRSLLLPAKFPDLPEQLSQYRSGDLRITNFEMETAAIYFLAVAMGHKALSVNAILANRVLNQFSDTPAETIQSVIEQVLNRALVSLF